MLRSVRKIYGDEPQHQEVDEFLSFSKKSRHHKDHDKKEKAAKGAQSRPGSLLKRRESVASWLTFSQKSYIQSYIQFRRVIQSIPCCSIITVEIVPVHNWQLHGGVIINFLLFVSNVLKKRVRLGYVRFLGK